VLGRFHNCSFWNRQDYAFMGAVADGKFTPNF